MTFFANGGYDFTDGPDDSVRSFFGHTVAAVGHQHFLGGGELNVRITLVHLAIDFDAPASRLSSIFLKESFFWRLRRSQRATVHGSAVRRSKNRSFPQLLRAPSKAARSGR